MTTWLIIFEGAVPHEEYYWSAPVNMQQNFELLMFFHIGEFIVVLRLLYGLTQYYSNSAHIKPVLALGDIAMTNAHYWWLHGMENIYGLILLNNSYPT